MGPASVRRGTMEARAAIGGFFLVTDYRQEWEGRTSFEGHGIHGWDERQKRVVWYWVDSMAFPPPAPAAGRWEEPERLVLGQSAPSGQVRYTWLLQGADRYLFRIEMSPDGKAWQVFMEGDYRRLP
jgi:hypothetical protein